MKPGLQILPLAGMPEVREGDEVGALIAAAAASSQVQLTDGDVIVVAQKVVSKAEGRVWDLAEVEPGDRAVELGARLSKDPRLVELILAESTRVVRAERSVLIVETKQGWICANAGIDASNVPGSEAVALLPVDPDASARRIREELAAATSARPALLVADTFVRPWRRGQTDVAIGCAGLVPLDDWRGRGDQHGRTLTATTIAVADELAGAADLARNKAEGVPAVVVRGAERWVSGDDGPGAAAIRRPAGEDLFR
jgi:coenzyme F420-0:L-glutamate ligase / coenzyme F420-1:gamma-L-glutamate ligase